eukprot:TRINITY_DN6979_c0_g1_i2.p1 TRINITY_DN6979_c0_g1~~TRINITY_DN6979_c0_g1_i2.p1  ORF type:complete len:157 (+),score=12.54 TRINITY_DN6979_c0_g1_i2:353-823(+)
MMVEYERWVQVNLTLWPIWFAALAVEGAYDAKGIKLGRFCGKKNHLGGLQTQHNCFLECICVVCREPSGAFSPCPVLSAVWAELDRINSSPQCFDKLMEAWFQPPQSWNDSFGLMTNFYVLDGELEPLNSISSTDGITLSRALLSAPESPYQHPAG